MLDPPEFLSDADSGVPDDSVVNTDYFDTVFFDSDKKPAGSYVFEAAVYHAMPVTLDLSASSGGSSGLSIDSSGCFIINDGSRKCGNAIVTLNAAYDERPEFSDQMTGSFRWASIADAKADITTVYDSCRTWGTTWWIGPNTCQKFAFFLEDEIRALKRNNCNVSCAIKTMNTVTFTNSGVISITSPKHAALQIIFIDGSELFYDNGAFGGIFTRSDFPSWSTPDF